MPGDYSFCRASAWINALINARAFIPPSVLSQLKALRLDSPLGKLALCALACPLYLVAPESSADSEIRVYLDPPAPEAFQKAAANPEKLALEMFLISDLTKLVNYLSRHWPRSLADAREKREILDQKFASLDALWSLLHPDPGERLRGLSDAELVDVAELLKESAPLWLWVAESREKADMPQGALAAADKALQFGSANAPRADWLRARVYFVRALAHWKMAQPALAETDLETAADLIANADPRAPLLAKIYLKLGEFYSLRRNLAAMCVAYERACAAGECGRLAAARRDGSCAGDGASR